MVLVGVGGGRGGGGGAEFPDVFFLLAPAGSTKLNIFLNDRSCSSSTQLFRHSIQDLKIDLSIAMHFFQLRLRLSSAAAHVLILYLSQHTDRHPLIFVSKGRQRTLRTRPGGGGGGGRGSFRCSRIFMHENHSVRAKSVLPTAL